MSKARRVSDISVSLYMRLVAHLSMDGDPRRRKTRKKKEEIQNLRGKKRKKEQIQNLRGKKKSRKFRI